MLAATCGGVRVVSVYVPNGREVGTEFYDRKLLWLHSLRDWLATTADPSDPLAVLGDFNVAPEDRDLWSVKAFEGATHVTPPEREAVAHLREWGMVDAFRAVYDDDRLFTYWDYRRGDFHQHRGMRIDLVLVTEPLAERIDVGARRPQRPQGQAAVRPRAAGRRLHRLNSRRPPRLAGEILPSLSALSAWLQQRVAMLESPRLGEKGGVGPWPVSGRSTVTPGCAASHGSRSGSSRVSVAAIGIVTAVVAEAAPGSSRTSTPTPTPGQTPTGAVDTVPGPTTTQPPIVDPGTVPATVSPAPPDDRGLVPPTDPPQPTRHRHVASSGGS